MSNSTTISFVGTPQIKTWLEKWAKQDDRSVSYVMRKILNQEVQRRQQTQAKTVQKESH